MSTQFATKRGALENVAFGIAGPDWKALLENLGEPKKEVVHCAIFGIDPPEDDPGTEIEVYEVTRGDGKRLEIGIEPFRDGYAGWVIDPETGNSMRL